MIISEVYRVAYIAPPKTATRTMYGVMKRYFQGKQQGDHTLRVPEEYKDFTTIIVIRNPYDRFVSMWMAATTRGDRYGFIKQTGSDNIVDGARMLVDLNVTSGKGHPLKWSQAIYHRENRIDYCIRLETLEQDFMDLPFVDKEVKFSHANPTEAKSKHWSEYYTDELIDLVNQFYKDDFELLPYKRCSSVKELK